MLCTNINYLQIDFIYENLRNDTPTIQALRKFILCDVRNKYCITEQTSRKGSYKLITKNQRFNVNANIC